MPIVSDDKGQNKQPCWQSTCDQVAGTDSKLHKALENVHKRTVAASLRGCQEICLVISTTTTTTTTTTLWEVLEHVCVFRCFPFAKWCAMVAHYSSRLERAHKITVEVDYANIGFIYICIYIYVFKPNVGFDRCFLLSAAPFPSRRISKVYPVEEEAAAPEAGGGGGGRPGSSASTSTSHGAPR